MKDAVCGILEQYDLLVLVTRGATAKDDLLFLPFLFSVRNVLTGFRARRLQDSNSGPEWAVPVRAV